MVILSQAHVLFLEWPSVCVCWQCQLAQQSQTWLFKARTHVPAKAVDEKNLIILVPVW